MDGVAGISAWSCWRSVVACWGACRYNMGSVSAHEAQYENVPWPGRRERGTTTMVTDVWVTHMDSFVSFRSPNGENRSCCLRASKFHGTRLERTPEVCCHCFLETCIFLFYVCFTHRMEESNPYTDMKIPGVFRVKTLFKCY